MPHIPIIISAIDNFLEINSKMSTTPPEVAEYLDKKGILDDNPARRGKPLRNLLRTGKIPHAYQNGSRWVIPHSGKWQNLKPLKSVKKEQSLQPKLKNSGNHKLETLAKWLCLYLEQNFKKKPDYFLEHKPNWLLSYPSQEILKEYPILNELYSDLVDKKYNLEDQLQKISSAARKRKQSYDIWIGEPFNFAVEFDEKQHFNQYRYFCFNHYKNIRTNFPLSYYKTFNKASKIQPGKSGFTKLKSNDPLFPEMIPGEAQDNRIRQRAFRDYLKDVLPLANCQNPTLRIPYQITNGKVKDFGSAEFQRLREYLDLINLKF